MNAHFEIGQLNRMIEDLLLAHPELADDETLRADMLEGETDLHAVLEKLVSMALEADTWAGAVKARRDELAERQKRFTDKYEVLRGLILSILERANLPKVQLVEATLSVRNIAPAPFVTDANLLPDNCVKIRREPDMAAIKAAMETLPFIDGVSMSNGKISLTIRTK